MKKTAGIIILLLIAIQFIRPAKTNPPTNPSKALHPPKKVAEILKRSCYDCHSNETKWPWYSDVAPFSWSVIDHVDEGRKAMNFSKWSEIPADIKTKRLKRAIQTINNGMMPLPGYLWIHKDAKLTEDEKTELGAYFKTLLEKIR